MGNKCCTGTNTKLKVKSLEDSQLANNQSPVTQSGFTRQLTVKPVQSLHIENDTRDDNFIIPEETKKIGKSHYRRNSDLKSGQRMPSDDRQSASPSSKQMSNQALQNLVIHPVQYAPELPPKAQQRQARSHHNTANSQQLQFMQGSHQLSNYQLNEVESNNVKIRISPSIKVSKDWVLDSVKPAQQSHQSDLMLPISLEEPEASAVAAANDAFMRKQSTIHQIQNRASPIKGVKNDYHMTLLPSAASAFELTLQKGGQSHGRRRSTMSVTSIVAKNESINTNRLSIMDDDLLIESEDNTLSRANSNDYQKTPSAVSQDKPNVADRNNIPFSSNKIKSENKNNDHQKSGSGVATNSYNSTMSPKNFRVSFGMRDPNMPVKQVTAQFPTQEHSFVNQPSVKSSNKDETHNKDNNNADHNKSQDSNFPYFAQNHIFSTSKFLNKKDSLDEENDEIENRDEFNTEEMMSPVLGKTRSNKEKENASTYQQNKLQQSIIQEEQYEQSLKSSPARFQGQAGVNTGSGSAVSQQQQINSSPFKTLKIVDQSTSSVQTGTAPEYKSSRGAAQMAPNSQKPPQMPSMMTFNRSSTLKLQGKRNSIMATGAINTREPSGSLGKRDAAAVLAYRNQHKAKAAAEIELILDQIIEPPKSVQVHFSKQPNYNFTVGSSIQSSTLQMLKKELSFSNRDILGGNQQQQLHQLQTVNRFESIAEEEKTPTDPTTNVPAVSKSEQKLNLNQNNHQSAPAELIEFNFGSGGNNLALKNNQSQVRKASHNVEGANQKRTVFAPGRIKSQKNLISFIREQSRNNLNELPPNNNQKDLALRTIQTASPFSSSQQNDMQQQQQQQQQIQSQQQIQALQLINQQSSIPVTPAMVLQNSSLFSYDNQNKRQKDLLRPIKNLTLKLDNDFQKINQLIEDRKKSVLKWKLKQYQSQGQIPILETRDTIINSQQTYHQKNDSNFSMPFTGLNSQLTQGGLQGIQGDQGATTSLRLRDSPISPLLDNRLADMSPLAETVEISEYLMRQSTLTNDQMSEMPLTPVSDNNRNNNSVSYSVIDVEYDYHHYYQQQSTSQNQQTGSGGYTNSKFTTTNGVVGGRGYKPFHKVQSNHQINSKQFTSDELHANTQRQGQVQQNQGNGGVYKPFYKTLSQTNGLQSMMKPMQQYNTSTQLIHMNELTDGNITQQFEDIITVDGGGPISPQPKINDEMQIGANKIMAGARVSRNADKKLITTRDTRSIISTKDDEGKKKINQYILIKTVGQGSFGKVKMALNTEENNKPYAMKVLSKRKLKKIFKGKNKTAMNDVMQEIAILKKLDHKNVVRLYEILDDPSVDKLYIVMEFVQNGSLMSKLNKSKTMQPVQLWKYFRDLIAGLHYLHECAGVAHRDIKPENLLIDDHDCLKISDFGVSSLFENGCDELTTTAGSNYFFSPEVCSGAVFKARKSDIWAAGVTLYYMFFKKYPFTGSNIPILYQKITTLEPEYPPDANPLIVSFLKRLLEKDQDKRITLAEIIQHDWITSNGIQPLQIHYSPQIVVTQADTMDAIQRVQLIAKIKLKIRQRIQQTQAYKKRTQQQQQSPQQQTIANNEPNTIKSRASSMMTAQ